jgi:hypothetical protein
MLMLPHRKIVWKVSVVAVFCVMSVTAAPLTEGNVAGYGSRWRPEHRVVSDGDDHRQSDTYFEFENWEDIDILLTWIDVPTESIHVAWRTVVSPYPNRIWVDHENNLDTGLFGVLLDLDANPATGTKTDSTTHRLPTYANPIIGVEIGLTTTFERRGEGPLQWSHGVWYWPSDSSMEDGHAGVARFGSLYDGQPGGPNAKWTEASWHFDVLTAGGRAAPQLGDLIGIAGVLRTPSPFGLDNEEITHGGLFLVGWGPVLRTNNGVSTIEISSLSGQTLVPSGLNIVYDEMNRTFVADGRPMSSPLGNPRYGDVTGDGYVSMYDVSLVLRESLSNARTLDPILGDVNNDGVVDVNDVHSIARRVVEPIFLLPAETHNHPIPKP